MALSNVSAAGSLLGRMVGCEPDCGGIVPKNQATGGVAATGMVVRRVVALQDDIASLRSELLQWRVGGQARQSRGMGGHSLRGVGGQLVPFTTALAARGVVMGAGGEELGLGAGSRGGRVCLSAKNSILFYSISMLASGPRSRTFGAA